MRILDILFFVLSINSFINRSNAINNNIENYQLITPNFQLNANITISRLGLGTAALQRLTKNVVYTALSLGYQLIDTAQAKEWYNEEQVGQGILQYMLSSHKKQSITIVTKVHPRSYEYNKMLDRMLLSRTYLLESTQSQSQVLDIVILHSHQCWSGHCTPEEAAITWQTAWKNLEYIKSLGYIANIGVSNFDDWQVLELLKITNTPINIIQNWMDPFHQDMEVRSICYQNNIVYMAYSSFGTQWEHKLGYNPVFQSSILSSLASKYETTISKVVLSWLLQENVIAIPRTATTSHLQDNIDLAVFDENNNIIAFKVFLSDEDMNIIRSLDGTLGSLWD